MSLRDVIGRGPSPVVCVCTNVVDERTHKIKNVCRPTFCSCQMADDGDADWLDEFDDEPLFGNLFEIERCEGDRNSSKHHETFSVPSGDIAQNCLNVEHAGMISTRETTHGGRWPNPGESYLSCKTEILNIDPSGSLQASLCGTGNCRINCSCNKRKENHDNEQQSCLSNTRVNVTVGQNDTRP